MTDPVLPQHLPAGVTPIVVAHGTRSPVGVATVAAIADLVAQRIGPTRVAFVDVLGPSPTDVLRDLDGPAVVVPAFLASGYHVRRDVPDQLAALGRGDVTVTEPFGPDPVLVDAALGRLRAAGWGAERVVLAAAGSTDEVAQADLRTAADLVAARLGAEVPVGYIAGGAPKLADVVAAQDGPVALLTWLLAPGVFHRWAGGSGAAVVAEPLGDHPGVIDVVCARYRTALAPAG